MSVEKQSKTWRAIVSYQVDGKRKKATKGGFKYKSEALAYETMLKAKLNQGYDIESSKQLFTEFYDTWLDNHIKSGIKQQTIANHIATQTIVHKHLQNITLEQMTRKRYQQFLDELSTTRTASSVHQISMRVGMCLKEAFSDGIIKTDPTFNLKFKGAHDSKPTDLKFLEEDEFNKLVKYIENSPMTAPNFMIYTAALSGMRAVEVLALTYSDFDVKNNKILVTKSKTNRVPYQYTAPKTKQSVREITMPTYYFEQLERFKQMFPNTDKHIFGEKTSQSVPSYRLRCLTKELDIKPISFHGLRHSHASILINNGVDIAYVSERLGHSSVSVTQKVYFHFLKKARENEEEKMLNVFKK